LNLTGQQTGIIVAGTFTNPGLVAAIKAAPQLYYVNVHSAPAGVGCPAGVLRGQFDNGFGSVLL
jgi:hypothetical protein